MVIDIVCLSFCLLYAIFGYFTGGLRQVFKLVAIVLAYLAAMWIVPVVLDLLYPHLGGYLVVIEFVCMAVVWAVLYLFLSYLGKLFIVTVIKASETVSSIDKYFGFFIGLLKAVVIIVLLMYFIGSAKESIFRLHPETRDIFEASETVAILTEINIIDEVFPEQAEDIYKLLTGMSKKAKQKVVVKDPEMKRLLENRDFVSLTGDENAMEDMRNGRMEELMEDPRFQKIIKDADIRTLLEKMKSGQMDLDLSGVMGSDQGDGTAVETGKKPPIEAEEKKDLKN